MMRTQPSPQLQRVLLADAAVSAGFGLLLALDAGWLAPLLNLPAPLLSTAGLLLLPWGAAVAWAGTRRSLPRAAIWTIIGINALWVLDSLLLLVSGWVAPTAAGSAFIVVQALAVALFAELQYSGLRRAA
jgi:hypothetical protein